MNDDQSMRDRVAGRPGPGDQSPEGGAGAGGAQPGGSPGISDDAQPGAGPAGDRQAGDRQAGDRPAGDRRAGDGRAGDGRAGDGRAGDGRAGDGRAPAAEASEPQAGPQKPDDEQAEGKRSRSFWRELPVLIVVALVIALVIKTFVVQAFFIPSSSMEDTLLIGDKVLVNKLVYHFRPIEPGDVIVFDGAGSWNPVPRPAPASSDPIVRLYDAALLPLLRSIGGLFGTAPGQTDYIKRVIGVPGDHVACCNAQGQVTVNGVALHERSYLYPGASPSQLHFSITVSPGRLWVMGDNRLVSDDSRLHTADPGGGTIPENKVIGRAFMIVWPPDRWRVLDIPATFEQPGISKAAAAAAGAVTARAGAAAPYLPLAGGLAAALPLTWLQRRVRLSPRRTRRRNLRRR
jgi:signal peptidase I